MSTYFDIQLKQEFTYSNNIETHNAFPGPAGHHI